MEENMPVVFLNEEYLSQRPELELVEDTDEELSDSGRVHGNGERKSKRGRVRSRVNTENKYLLVSF